MDNVTVRRLETLMRPGAAGDTQVGAHAQASPGAQHISSEYIAWPSTTSTAVAHKRALFGITGHGFGAEFS